MLGQCSLHHKGINLQCLQRKHCFVVCLTVKAAPSCSTLMYHGVIKSHLMVLSY